MTHRKLVSMDAELYRRVEDYRWDNRFNTESEALRRLIGAGLDAMMVIADLAIPPEEDAAAGYMPHEIVEAAGRRRQRARDWLARYGETHG